MTGIIILCAAAVVLGAILFTPIRVLVRYEEGELAAGVKAAFLRIPLYPRAEKAAAKKEKKPKKQNDAEKKEKKKLRINMEQILYSLEKLPPVLGKALGRFGSRIRIDPLQVHLLVAGPDPADTAVLYGRLTAAVEGALPALHGALRIREQEIRLYPDFQQERMDCIADVGVSIRLWDVLVIGACAGAALVVWFIGFRRLADKPAAAAQQQDNEAA